MLDARIVQHLVAGFLQRQVGDDRDQIGVAAALAEAVDRALHLHGARRDRGQRIGHGQFAIVVAMNADRHVQPGSGGAGQVGDLLRHAAAVGVAQDDHARLRRRRRPEWS